MSFVELNVISNSLIILCINFLHQYFCTLLRLTTVIKDNLLTYLLKCAVMHFGFANEGMEVRLGDKVLSVQKSERDLGVIMHISADPITK